MAVNHFETRSCSYTTEALFEALRSETYSKLIDAKFVREYKNADQPNTTVFRYERYTTMMRYGRNYEVAITPKEDGTTDVGISTQSRKVTVLFDPEWKKEVEKCFVQLGLLIRSSQNTHE